MAGVPKPVTRSTLVTKPATMVAVIALLTWLAHGIQTNEWTALPSSASQFLIDALPAIAAGLYTLIKHVLRDKLGWDLHWLG